MRILFTSAGRRVELAQCFRAAASQLGANCEIHACDLNPDLSPACRKADFSFAVPRCTEPGYVDVLHEYCEARSIDLLVPTIDPELPFLAAARDRFAQSGTIVHVSSPEAIDIVRDKQKTIEALAAVGVPVPRTASADEARRFSNEWSFPAFIKPSGGSASRGIGALRGPEDIRDDYDEPMIVQEFLQGPEYTVNIYVDGHGKLLSAVPHIRLSVRAGEVEKGRTERNPAFWEIAKGVVASLPKPRGAMCFQLIVDPDKGPRVFEINARFGGGYPLADHAGARFAESLLAGLLGRPECASNEWREDVTMLRYDAAVFDG
ncbi:MAG: ATP-grasp domain-containing protein [Porphyrobacter sp.]|nr:ATP-grasp domain-containing protein [Porphyrobacter sp.]